MLGSVGAAVGHRDPDLREHFCGHPLDAVGEAARCRSETRGGDDDTDGSGRSERLQVATSTACRAQPRRRARSDRPEKCDRFEFAGEFGLGGRPSGGGQEVDEWLVGGWNRIILGGVQELIDQRVVEGEGIVVDGGLGRPRGMSPLSATRPFISLRLAPSGRRRLLCQRPQCAVTEHPNCAVGLVDDRRGLAHGQPDDDPQDHHFPLVRGESARQRQGRCERCIGIHQRRAGGHRVRHVEPAEWSGAQLALAAAGSMARRRAVVNTQAGSRARRPRTPKGHE